MLLVLLDAGGEPLREKYPATGGLAAAFYGALRAVHGPRAGRPRLAYLLACDEAARRAYPNWIHASPDCSRWSQLGNADDGCDTARKEAKRARAEEEADAERARGVDQRVQNVESLLETLSANVEALLADNERTSRAASPVKKGLGSSQDLPPGKGGAPSAGAPSQR